MVVNGFMKPCLAGFPLFIMYMKYTIYCLQYYNLSWAFDVVVKRDDYSFLSGHWRNTINKYLNRFLIILNNIRSAIYTCKNVKIGNLIGREY